MELKYKKLSETAILNPHAHSTDAGLDLVSIKEVTLEPHTPIKVETGMSVEIPDGYVGLVWDKSSIGSLGIKTLGGVIDSGYRGEIIIILINLTNEKIVLPPQKKIAQLIIQKYESATPLLSEDLSNTNRGDNGFGSTGA